MRNCTILAVLSFIFLSLPALAKAQPQPDRETSLSLGYRLVDDQGDAKVREYDHLQPSTTLRFLASGYDDRFHGSLEGYLLSDKDYRSELHFDRDGQVRLDLRIENFVHNLEHIPYSDRPPAIAQDNGTPIPPPPPVINPNKATFTDHDPTAEYRLDTGIYEARFRGKLKSYPAHLNVRYWRMERKGDRQLRFVDEQCSGCHVQSRSVRIDQVTQEVTAGLDAHLGPVDVILEQLYRQFDNRENAPVDSYGTNVFFRPTATDLAHDTIPDVRMTESTLKVHTNLAGGLVGAASASIGKRENRNGLEPAQVSPIISSTDVAKGAGDLTWIPHPSWTFNFRYRLLDLDNSNTDSISITGVTTGISPVGVRNNPDLRRDSYLITASFRPDARLKLKGQFDREIIHRDQTGPALPYTSAKPTIGVPQELDPVWELPRQERNDRIRFSLYTRPLGDRRLRINTWWEYRTSSDPAYGTSFEDSHRLFFSTSYQHPQGRWGANLLLDRLWQQNDQFEITEFDETTGLPVSFDLGRSKRQFHLSAGFWGDLTESLSASMTYGYLASTIEQDLLFGNAPPDYAIEDSGVRYDQRTHTLAVHLNWRVTDPVLLELSGYHVRSYAAYSPGFSRFYAPTGVFDATSEGLKDISRVDLRQLGLSVGTTWAVTDNLSWAARYSFDDYEDRTGNVFDGHVQSCEVSLSYAW
ncbi:hypothetical protein EDC39_106143 [Geothermobacter ehrlichii]|uniref:Uncharacterized protein n=1 Tax=Geothermobacter ehrlichii TaxID=213224 RepID=A0A5D3WJ54_9BACT|nr:MtrB/PioB family outer membrane beta-barrel protein [Geothermobacter ehrlichii]TYO98540.1 hypothetical protein EDC39_106143 [Geothermobacter ehrlichii]